MWKKCFYLDEYTDDCCRHKHDHCFNQCKCHQRCDAVLGELCECLNSVCKMRKHHYHNEWNSCGCNQCRKKKEHHWHDDWDFCVCKKCVKKKKKKKKH